MASLAPRSSSRERLAAAASYGVFWVTGVLIFFIARRPFVRYHAAQSTVAFGALQGLVLILRQLLGVRFVLGEWTDISLSWLLLMSVVLLELCIWLLCIWQASRGRWFKVPGASGIAQALAAAS